MRAAKDLPTTFHAVAHDLTTAMRARGRNHVNRTLETVERVRFSGGRNLKRFIVIIPAHVAFSHGTPRYFWGQSHPAARPAIRNHDEIAGLSAETTIRYFFAPVESFSRGHVSSRRRCRSEITFCAL